MKKNKKDYIYFYTLLLPRSQATAYSCLLLIPKGSAMLDSSTTLFLPHSCNSCFRPSFPQNRGRQFQADGLSQLFCDCFITQCSEASSSLKLFLWRYLLPFKRIPLPPHAMPSPRIVQKKVAGDIHDWFLCTLDACTHSFVYCHFGLILSCLGCHTLGR